MADTIDAFAAFWAFYRPRRDDIWKVATRDVPRLATFLAAMSAEDRATFGPGLDRGAQAVARTRSFEPLVASLRALGAAYARGGVTFADVYATAAGVRVIAFDLIQRDAAGELVLLTRGLHEYLDHAMHHIGEAYLETRDRLLAEGRRQLLERAIPLLEVAPRVLLVPLIGELASDQMPTLTARVLERIRAERVHTLIVDVTGIMRVDPRAVAGLGELMSASRLMGARAIVSGVSAELANALVDREVDLGAVIIEGRLSQAVADALRP